MKITCTYIYIYTYIRYMDVSINTINVYGNLHVNVNVKGYTCNKHALYMLI